MNIGWKNSKKGFGAIYPCIFILPLKGNAFRAFSLAKRKNFSFPVNIYKKVSRVVSAWQERIKTQPIDVDARELLTKHSKEKQLFAVLLSSIHNIR